MFSVEVNAIISGSDGLVLRYLQHSRIKSKLQPMTVENMLLFLSLLHGHVPKHSIATRRRVKVIARFATIMLEIQMLQVVSVATSTVAPWLSLISSVVQSGI